MNRGANLHIFFENQSYTLIKEKSIIFPASLSTPFGMVSERSLHRCRIVCVDHFNMVWHSSFLLSVLVLGWRSKIHWLLSNRRKKQGITDIDVVEAVEYY